MPDLTYQDVLNILRLIDSGTFSDFQLEFEGTKVKVSRQIAPQLVCAKSATEPIHAAVQPSESGVSSVSKINTKDASASVTARRVPVKVPNGVEVKTPMEGTFYSAPAPNAAPFVEVDRAVRKGDQLGIVEVMKLFTPVVSPCDGTVRAILVANQELVRKDQILMMIEPENIVDIDDAQAQRGGAPEQTETTS